LAIQFGGDPAKLYRANVSMPGGDDQIDHYCALAEIDGDWWVFGDTEGPVQPLSRSGHTVIKLAAVADGLNGWRHWEA